MPNPRLIIALLAIFIASCTPRGELTFTDEKNVGTQHQIYVGTTRTPSGGESFTSTRSNVTHYARYDISVPPTHTPGQIEWAKPGKTDPEKHFAVTEMLPFSDQQAFKSSMRKSLRSLPKGKRRAYVYVHGYYNNFADSLYRSAQIAQEFDITEVFAHFAWPSAGTPFGYGKDRDSILVARDSFEAFLKTIKSAGAEEIVIVAHSLGGALTMETLRSIAIGGENAVPNLIDGVGLISPDLDVDLFVTQTNRIGKLPDFFIIVTSSADQALRLSARISGEKARLGNIQDLTPIAHLDTIVFDVSALSSVRNNNHETAFENPAAIDFIRKMTSNGTVLAGGKSYRPGPVSNAVISIQSLTRIVLSPDIPQN